MRLCPKVLMGAGRFVVLTLLLGVVLIPSSDAQEPSCVIPRMDEVNARVRAQVTRSGEKFKYTYFLENSLGAKLVLDTFAVEAQVNASVPPTQLTPTNWKAGGPIAKTRFYAWGTFIEPRGLLPGQAVTGFAFEHPDALPAIVTFLAWGDVELPSFPEGEAPDSCEGDDVIENSFKGKTVGPRLAQEPFTTLEFVNYLITLVHDSRKQSWIKVEGVQKSLLAKLLNMKRRLEAGRVSEARNILNAFVSEVSAVSCTEFTCPGNKPLTSEAYALLFFNGQYLLEHLR